VVPERVAYHTLRGGVRDRAGLWSARSGEAALRIYGFAEAVSHFGLARELATTPADELAALSGLGDALVGLGRPEEAVGRLTAALPLAPDDETKADLWRRIGRAHERQGAYDRALEAFSAAQGLLDEHPMSLATLLAADGLATVNLRLGRHEEAARVSSEGLSWLADQTTLDARSREQAESWLRNTLGMAEMQAADYAGALEQLTLGLALKRRVGDRLGEATLLNNIGVVHYHCGDDEPARDHYAASLAIKEEIGDRYGRAIALTNLALVETHLGDLAAASAHLAAAAADAERVTAQWLQPEIQRVRAQLALAMAEPAAALAAANAALEVAEELAVPAHIGVAHRVMGRVTAEALGDPQAADEHFQTSLAVFEMLENEHELAKTRVAYGRMLAAEGRGEDAAAQLRWAREVFRRSGAQGRLRQVDHLLSEASDPR
jgi:tetratricopeptide (TPR) repeat protein